MKENSRRKFNIIDLLAVLLILAALCFVGWKLVNRGGGEAGGEVNMVHVVYTVKV